MGEIADMMIKGFMCEACGVYLDGEEPGYAYYCSADCAKDRGAEFIDGNDFDYDENDEDDEQPTIENVEDLIDSAISLLELAQIDLFRLNRKKKSKSIDGIIKMIEIFRDSIK
jgi:hypothetical protein